MIEDVMQNEIAAWATLASLQTPPLLLSPASDKKFILEHGQLWKIDIRAHHGGAPAKMCFRNAVRRALAEGLLYVEGFGLTPSLALPMHHAWVGTPLGHVVEPTWRAAPYDLPEYYGIAFDPEEAFRLMTKRGSYGLLDFGDKWCRTFIEQRWPGTFPATGAKHGEDRTEARALDG